MEIDCLPFYKTGYFTEFICDYLAEEPQVRNFYHRFPNLDNFEAQIAEKATSFPDGNREVLYEALQKQYKGFEVTDATRTHLKKLKEPITFTVVTGHQLNLFTGPLYFLYKIVSTINLTKELKTAYPKYNFVPVYWMATEDHDFEEINYFNFRGKKLKWNRTASGAVGHLDTKGLDEIFEAFSNQIGNSANAKALKELFRKSYLGHTNLAEATRYLANELFGKEGLVIVDGDDRNLKSLLLPYAEKDIFDQLAYKKVSETITGFEALDKKYGVQVNPREINYFYLKDGLRERIVEQNGAYFVNDTEIRFTKEELQKELKVYPERFSPNVIARPLYQEVILPNLCYIGGGGEIAYWLELKTMFEAMQVPFPVLLLRNSALVITDKQKGKLEKMNLSVADIFLRQSSFINKKIREISNIDIDFTPQKQYLEEQFKAMYDLAEQTDASFLGAVKAQEVKQKKGLENLEKRLLQAQKRKLKDHVMRMTEIQNELFPNKSLQERNVNFSELYLELGEDLIPMLLEALKPLQLEFTVIKV
ncbi:bacillithiol biosynthesis cysteine-adding enzyme BshC [Zobellia galactanivorans]|uniref:bacillithiol biosynthesis cysteine-adding enzyme BshC n=1 Tax=Zobellia galactanivorans (strain DSM 12802 / CCUG 47099 / CIP 106680 / NCIMB 13871 / Dsij) TaxID=63186 RepID=UPI0026E1CC6D|nr:bacillithiol biosynthesis cysteine-adding enzyme BshC [Zobellia galactanivorans]MDO6810183.1 bacillithiol biosynthesis cysteine-adding enzyme BshC [Zobellia galactanivorans]